MVLPGRERPLLVSLSGLDRRGKRVSITAVAPPAGKLIRRFRNRPRHRLLRARLRKTSWALTMTKPQPQGAVGSISNDRGSLPGGGTQGSRPALLPQDKTVRGILKGLGAPAVCYVMSSGSELGSAIENGNTASSPWTFYGSCDF